MAMLRFELSGEIRLTDEDVNQLKEEFGTDDLNDIRAEDAAEALGIWGQDLTDNATFEEWNW